MRRAALFIVASFVAVLFAAPAAWACSCIAQGPACQTFFKTAAVFAGTVQSIQTRDGEKGASIWLQQGVHIKVSQRFSGPSDAELDVLTGMGGGDCGYDFKIGVAYLIYAENGTDGLSTGICTRTRPLSAAAEDLEFLKTMSATPRAQGRLFGSATYIDDSAPESGPMLRKPVANVRVTFAAVNDSFTQTVESSADGKYGIDAPPGEYRVSFVVPTGYYANGPWPNPVRLADVRGCAIADVTLKDDGHIRGRVVDTAGDPVPNLSMQLVELTNDSLVRWTTTVARTGADGRYEFEHQPAKNYAVGVNLPQYENQRGYVGSPAFLPGVEQVSGAATITLPQRGTIDAPDFVLPKTVQVLQLTGIVVGVDGKPRVGARVSLHTVDFRSMGDAVLSDAQGRFAVAVTPGVVYVAVAETSRTDDGHVERGDTSSITATVNMASITITLIKR